MFNKMDKYDLAIGLFYGAYLMLAIAIFLVVGLINNDGMVWATAFMGCTFGFLFLGLITQGIIIIFKKN